MPATTDPTTSTVAETDSTTVNAQVTDTGTADKGTAGEQAKTVDVAALKAKRREKANEGKDKDNTKPTGSEGVSSKADTKDESDESQANNPGTDKAKDDKGTLSQFVSLRKTITELEGKVKAHEPVAALAKKIGEAEALAKSGKHYDAIRLLGFVDFDAAAREVMGLEPDAGAAKSKEASDELKQALDRVGALEAKLADKETAEQTAKAEAAKAEGMKQIKDMIKGPQKDKFKFLSKSDEWIEAALKGSDEAYLTIMAKRAKAGNKEDLSDQDKNKLILTALLEGEKLRAKESELYGAKEDTADQERAPVTGITSDSRGGRIVRPAGKEKLKSIEALKAARRARAN